MRITPHVAAVSFPEQVADVFAANLRRFEADQELRFVVDLAAAY